MDKPVFDFLTRQQVYVEGVKVWQQADFKRYLKLLADAIREFLTKAGVKTLGELPATKFRALLKRITNKVGDVLGNFSTEWLTEMKRFTFASTRMQQGAFAVTVPEAAIAAPPASIWSKVKDKIVPAFGKKTTEQLSDFVAIAKDKVRVRINAGFADNEDVMETANAVTNINAKTFSSTLSQIGNQARGLISTALQHASQTVTDVLGAIAFDCYQWASVIDSRTTEVCRERNGQVYRNGTGPLPPAHNNCRSHTVPCDCGEQPKVPPFFSWLLGQSKDFIRDAFGDSVAEKFANDTLTQGDVGDFKALSLDDFESKAKFLTA